MNPAALVGLTPASIREHLSGFVCGAVEAEPAVVQRLEASLDHLVAGASDDDVLKMQAAFSRAGDSFSVFRADPLARRLTRQHLQDLTTGSTVSGLEHLEGVSGRPQVWLCNHLSYTDTQVLDGLLAHRGVAQADDLLVVAGPKVYTDAYRRVASIGLNTLKTVQSATVAQDGPVMAPRELARIALETQRLAADWRDQRGPILIYPEGSRSPDGHLQPFLRGVHRWIRRPADLVIVPVGHGGAERLFARDERMRPQSVTLRFGTPFTVGEATGASKHGVLEEAWSRIADLVPAAQRPRTDTPAVA